MILSVLVQANLSQNFQVMAGDQVLEMTIPAAVTLTGIQVPGVTVQALVTFLTKKSFALLQFAQIIWQRC